MTFEKFSSDGRVQSAIKIGGILGVLALIGIVASLVVGDREGQALLYASIFVLVVWSVSFGVVALAVTRGRS